jgi:hypothetical protein
MEEEKRVLEGPAKLSKKKKRPHKRSNENGDLRNFSFSGVSFEVDDWTLVRGPKRKSPRVQSLSISA